MPRKTFLWAPISLLLATGIAWAESDSAKVARARTACLAGDYAQGVATLAELFVATKDPTFIYNQGRCFEQNRRYEDAIARFQEYLRAGKNLSSDDKADTQKQIEDCRKLLASERADTAATPQPPSQTPTESQARHSSFAPTVRQNRPRTHGGSRSLRVAGISTASVGGAALLSGILFNLKSNSLAQDLKQTDGYSPDKESRRKTYRTLGWVGYGVGAACIAAGTVLYVLGMPSANHSSVALLPLAGPRLAGAVVKGEF